MIEAAARIAPASWQPIAPAAPLLAASAAPRTAAANDGLTPDHVRTNAALSADVYRAEPTPPAGYRVASAADLDRLGVSPEMLEQPGSSFRARVYVSGDSYVVAFRGSQTGEDWKNNVQQALGLNSESYAKALEIGKAIARVDADVSFTGHSLGGGLASAAAVASGREAVTFNASGLSDRTIAGARSIASANGRGAASVHAFYVPGDALHLIQEGGDRAIGFTLGGIAGGALADAPEAYGTQHALPDVRPADRNWFEGLNPIDRHGIDWVVAGAGAL